MEKTVKEAQMRRLANMVESSFRTSGFDKSHWYKNGKNEGEN